MRVVTRLRAGLVSSHHHAIRHCSGFGVHKASGAALKDSSL